MRIRNVKPSDRTEWLRLLVGLYPDHPATEHVPDVDAYFSGTNHSALVPSVVFVYERTGDGGLAGFLELSVRNYAEGCDGPTPYIESWYVDPDMRGQGVGRALVEAAEQWSRDHDYREIASDTELANLRSQKAHRALRFEEVERAVHFRKAL